MRGRTGRTCALALAGALVWTGMADAKTFEVTKRTDPVPGSCTPNDCSLREAVLRANARPGADSIVLPSRRPYRLTIAGTQEDGALDGDLDVSNHRLSIGHPGKGKATIAGDGIGESLFGGFAPVAFRKLVLTGGTATGPDADGGVIQTDFDLRITKSVLRGNHANNVGGAIDMENEGALRISRSTFRGNTADNTAGAIRDGDGFVSIARSRFIGNAADSDGGAIRFSSSGFRIVKSTFVGNQSGDEGGAIQTDVEEGQVLKKSTIAGNTADNEGGGISASGGDGVVRIVSSTISGNRSAGDGGGLDVDASRAAVTNSTIANNRADGEGGGINSESIAEVSLNAVTVVRNRSAADDPGPVPPSGGGLRHNGLSFEVRNSLIGLNTIGIGGIQRQDCEGNTFTSLGHNLISTDVECDGFTRPSDLVRSNPKIGKLRKNGGPTKTVALKRGSAAIGHAHKPSAPNRDQRGRKRDRNPDAGAFERGA